MQPMRVLGAIIALGAVGLRAGESLGRTPPVRVELARTTPVLVSVTNIATGQRIVPGAEPDLSPPTQPTRGSTVAFDTMTSDRSSAHLNVAYLERGSYDGSDPATTAYAIGLAERLFYRAPMDNSAGFPLPTDILWNDYACAPSRWPGGATGAPQALASFGLVPYFQNSEPPVAPRTHTLHVEFFSTNRTTSYGGFEAEFHVTAGQTGYFGTTIDVSAFDPPIRVPPSGLVMVDWTEPNNSGVGCMFTGGDLINPGYPTPASLWTWGSADPEIWLFADGVIGQGGLPNMVNPGFDGDPSSASYLDVLNTGNLANWEFAVGNPPFAIPPRDFACRIAIQAGPPPPPLCPCDIDGSGVVNSQDFFNFLTNFFMGMEDFNHSGATDSQDYFDFLICFFSPC